MFIFIMISAISAVMPAVAMIATVVTATVVDKYEFQILK